MTKQKQKGITFGYCDLNSGQRVYPAMSILLPEQLPPPQALPLSGEEQNMLAKITCTPPLGQVTVIPKHATAVPFSVLLETNASSSVQDRDISVSLWHSHAGNNDWTELALESTNHLDQTMLPVSSKQTTRRWYTAELPGAPHHSLPVSFTLKFKVGSESGWKWVHDQTGIADGQLHYQRSQIDHDLSFYFHGISSDLRSRGEKADTSDTKLFHITAPVRPASGEESGYSTYSLGTPATYSKWFSLVRLWSPWLAPRQGKDKFNPDKDAVLASFLRHDGLHVVCLAISGVGDVLTVFKHDGNGNVIIQGRNDREEEGTSHVVVAIAETFEVANAAVMYYARKVVSSYTSAVGGTQPEIQELMDQNVKAEWLEEWYDGLTYCTWNALGQDLTEEKINNALDVLKKENINITNLIIDDNWQSLSEGDTQFTRAWLDFDANKKGFPRGLKKTITDLRDNHPNINHIAVWHAILGYWGGVSPHGQIAKDYKTIRVQKEKGVAEGEFTVVDASDAPRMYNDFYRFLSDCGITAVKTDAQFFLDLISQASARRDLTTVYQDAWTVAHLRHFSSRAISCMSQTPPILFHSQLPTNKPLLLVRNSDDFFPEVAASHPWHIFCNAHNSLLTQHLNVLPDWDMFQTSHEWASFHAAARCVSGGPIYFTDVPGQHDIKLIQQMTAQTPHGKTVILRPHTIGKSMNAYVGYDETALLKVGTYVGFARTGTAILGIFNCTPGPIAEFVRLDDFPGTDEGTYVVRTFGGAVSRPMRRGQQAAFVGVDVNVRGWEILAAHPVTEFAIKSGPVTIAQLGLVGKMTGAAAVQGYDVYVEDSGRLRIWLSLKALGVLGLYVQNLASKSLDEHFLVTLFGKPVARHCVQRSKASTEVLEVDVERAWKESGEDAGWSNEVSIEVFVS